MAIKRSKKRLPSLCILLKRKAVILVCLLESRLPSSTRNACTGDCQPPRLYTNFNSELNKLMIQALPEKHSQRLDFSWTFHTARLLIRYRLARDVSQVEKREIQWTRTYLNTGLMSVWHKRRSVSKSIPRSSRATISVTHQKLDLACSRTLEFSPSLDYLKGSSERSITDSAGVCVMVDPKSKASLTLACSGVNAVLCPLVPSFAFEFSFSSSFA